MACYLIIPTLFRLNLRRMCWDLGAFTSAELHDPDVSHVIISSQHKVDDPIVCFPFRFLNKFH